MQKLTISALCIFGFFVAVTYARAQDAKPDFIKQYEKSGLPKSTDIPQFDTSKSLPLPKGTTNYQAAFKLKADPASAEEIQELKDALSSTSNSVDLKSKLGTDSKLLTGGILPRSRLAKTEDPNEYKFTYYNYKTGRAIEAYVSNKQVNRVVERDAGYQPSASNAELTEAAKILSIQQSGDAGSISTESLRGIAQSGPNGRRQIYLIGNVGGVKKTATVDLQEKKLINSTTVDRQEK